MNCDRQSRRIAAVAFLIAMVVIGCSRSHAQQALVLEAKIPLGQVRGRIDHLAVDLRRSRLFVAELGNDSVGVVDISGRKVVHRITGLDEPQGARTTSRTWRDSSRPTTRCTPTASRSRRGRRAALQDLDPAGQ